MFFIAKINVSFTKIAPLFNGVQELNPKPNVRLGYFVKA
jgi:hypothetical protein